VQDICSLSGTWLSTVSLPFFALSPVLRTFHYFYERTSPLYLSSHVHRAFRRFPVIPRCGEFSRVTKYLHESLSETLDTCSTVLEMPRLLYNPKLHYKSSDSSVGIALGYVLDDRGSRIRFPAGAGNFSLHHCLQNGSGAHPASYPMVTRGFFPGGKEAGAWSWPLTSI
jgi:hypothetical protein